MPADTSTIPARMEEKAVYPTVVPLPTQTAAQGIRFDFNRGARVLLPDRADGIWGVRLRDHDTGNILFQSENQGAFVSSTKRWFVRFHIEVWDKEGIVFDHVFDARGRDVLVQFPADAPGDTLAWFPYAARFAELHGCRLSCALSGTIIPLLKDAYPDIRLVTHEELVRQRLAESFYATYGVGLFLDDTALDWQPVDFRLAGLHRTAGAILGVGPQEEPLRLALPDHAPPSAEPYACISVQSGSGSRLWHNPTGWPAVIAFLKAQGYRVICIDSPSLHGAAGPRIPIPYGAEDQTGDRPLTETARWLRHASVFVGLSTGLSWLAWAAGCPVVLISGATHVINEFSTPYRIINWHVCNSCWNDPRLRFDPGDFLCCPRHKNTQRHFECTRMISREPVIVAVSRALNLPDQAGPEVLR